MPDERNINSKTKAKMAVRRKGHDEHTIPCSYVNCMQKISQNNIITNTITESEKVKLGRESHWKVTIFGSFVRFRCALLVRGCIQSLIFFVLIHTLLYSSYYVYSKQNNYTYINKPTSKYYMMMSISIKHQS